MKRLHAHVSVDDLAQSVRFYSTLFAAEPAVARADYAKWMLDDPRVNFAISTRSGGAGLDHLGIQVETPDELQDAGPDSDGDAGVRRIAELQRGEHAAPARPLDAHVHHSEPVECAARLWAIRRRGAYEPSTNYDRVVDVMEELLRFTW
jgi:catechol 2,3-dioxygenase-like lactoylglutathione lyase family enzyme